MPFAVCMANSGKQLPKCKYGSLCYRTNADHRMEYWHPEYLSNSITNDSEEHSPDAGPKDGRKNAVSFHSSPLCASNSSLAHVLDEEIEGAPEGERGRYSLERMKTGINECGLKDSTRRDAPTITSNSVKTAGAGVLLLLIGVPGSGKSTFCFKLMSNAAQPWTRICQDIIAKGKRGTKKECLKHTERVLTQKGSVVIDRCNIDTVQRLEFLQLAASFGVEAHGIVLDLPASVCIQRASKRIGHEGGVNAINAGSIINRFTTTRQLPSLSEGFSRITVCRSDVDVEKVVQQYRELLPSKHLESEISGAAVNKSKNALQSVLGKGSDQRHWGNNIDNKGRHPEKVREGPQQAQAVGGREKAELMLEAWSSCRREACNTRDLASSVCMEDQGACSLAFPSISTSDFQFDHEKAASVLVEAAAKVLVTEDSKMRLILVDLKNSHMLSLVSRKAREKGLDPNRFLTFVGDITKLRTSNGPACNVIANAANWRLKAGGGGVNAAIYSAAGPELERATKKVALTISPGTSVIVQLPESSPFYIYEGVTHVIHVLGPNMNPQRPNSLSGDYSEGCRLLQSSYASLFQNFSSIVKSIGGVESSGKVEASNTVDSSSKEEANGETIVGSRISYEKPSKNAFTVLMQASKRNRELKDPNPKRDKVRVTEEVLARASRGSDETVYSLELDTSKSRGPEKFSLPNQHHSNLGGTSTGRCPRAAARREETETKSQEGLTTAYQQGGANNGKRWDDRALALYEISMHPEEHTDVVLQITDDAVVLHDMYPKAKRHLLVVARRPALDSLDNLQREHLPVLRHMHSLGGEWAAHYLKADPSLSFRLGYHVVSSMRQVHLHLISQDFDSSSLKNKKNWNSFTTPFFRDSLHLLDQLEEHGQVQNSVTDAERLLDVELRCHRCRSAHPNLSRLKQHISKCRHPFANSSFFITTQSLGL